MPMRSCWARGARTRRAPPNHTPAPGALLGERVQDALVLLGRGLHGLGRHALLVTREVARTVAAELAVEAVKGPLDAQQQARLVAARRLEVLALHREDDPAGQ